MTESRPQRPFEKEDFFHLNYLHSAELSPDGQYVAYSVLTTDTDEDEDHINLWLGHVETGETRQLTHGSGDNYNPRWSRDGETIAFISTRSGKPQVYLLPLDGGEAYPLTRFEQGVSDGPVWSPDGTKIAVTAGLAKEDAPDFSKPFRVSRHVYRSDGMGFVDGALQNIYVVTVADGAVEQITDTPCVNVDPQWSPDGRRLMYGARMRPHTHNMFLANYRIVDLQSREERDVLDESWGFAYEARWMPDGQRIAFSGAPHRRPGPFAGKTDLWLVDVETGSSSGGAFPAPERRTAGLAYGLGSGLAPDMPSGLRWAGGICITADGTSAYVPVETCGMDHIYRVALVGEEHWQPVLTGERACLLLGLSRDECSLFYGVATFNSPPELYRCDADGKNERQLTHLNAELLSSLALPSVVNLRFKSVDGAEVEGWLLKPSTGEAPFPTVMVIHGGPYNCTGHTFHADSQILAGAGYAVLTINYRGSTGYGEAFSAALSEQGWGNLNYADMMAGVDYAVELGLADPDRLGVCGISAGGYGSCWVIGQTTRFKAAVPENPVTNWISIYGTSDIGAWWIPAEFGGQPHEIPDVLLRASPVMHAHKCMTPTLLIQSEQDWRCPPEQSEQFYAVLKANGCTVEMLRLTNSSHGGSIAGAPHVRRAQNDALLDWMNRYVLGKPPDGSAD